MVQELEKGEGTGPCCGFQFVNRSAIRPSFRFAELQSLLTSIHILIGEPGIRLWTI